MSIFDIFRWKAKYDEDGPEIKFGRYSDAFKDEVKYSLYENAIAQFEEGNLMHSVILLLDFLREDMNDNVQYDLEGDELFFQMLQGSKIILGRCNLEKFVAISEIASLSKQNVGLYRRLLDKNYLFRYVRFCVNDSQELSLKFDSFMKDASPKKLYHALKELSINADKYDDILVDEFEELSETNAGRIIELEPKVKQIKEKYLRKEITEVLAKVSKLNGHSEKFHSGVSYLLLYCNYKLDFLIKPEGFVMELLERNHRLFFTNNKLPEEKKNKIIIKNLEEILTRSSQQMQDEFYDTVHTFGYTQPASHEQLKALIVTELTKFNHYLSSNQQDMALAVTGYIVGYGLFYFGFPPPDVDMLKLLLRMLEHEYYKDLGFKTDFIEGEEIIEKQVKAGIRSIQDKHQELYPEFQPNISSLRFDNLLVFSHSFLKMVREYNIHYRGHIA